MQRGKNNRAGQPACSEFEPLRILFATGELDDSAQSRLSEHLAACDACRADFEEEKRLLSLFSEIREEPDAALLSSCRASLMDALDREEEGGWLRRSVRALVPSSWLAPRPAWSTALLLMLGFSVGILGPRYFLHLRAATPRIGAGSISANSAVTPSRDSNTAPLSTLDLHSAEVAGINVFPSGGDTPPQVELQLKAQQPLMVHGTVDNDDVKRVLLDVLRNNQGSDPDVRLYAVDLLRARNNDPDVRSALCHAVHTDHNAAVRLKALEALNGAESQELVRQTLLDALVDDQNPGVRVEAINALRDMAASGQVSPDEHMLAVLRERMRSDPNTYIRLQSAAAIRDLGPSQKF